MPQLLVLSRWARNERENNVTSVTHSALEHFYTNAARELGTRTLLAHNIWAEAKDGIGVPEFVNLKIGVTTSYEILYAELRSNGVDT